MTNSTLTYQPIDFRDPSIWSQIVALETKTFPDLSAGQLKHILLDSHERTLLMGCMDQERVVGLNGFIAHPVCHNGTQGMAFQSCITATDTNYRGQGIFQGLINGAKEILRAQSDAAFIFGYPNNNSGPIFCKKLDFNLRRMVSIDFSRLVFEKSPMAVFNLDKLQTEFAALESRVQFDARHTSAWKQDGSMEAVRSDENYTNYIFGRTASKRLGPLRMNMFRVGGMEVNKPPIFHRLVKQVASDCSIIRMVVPEDSPFAQSGRLVRVGSKTEPLIDFPLNWPSSDMQLDAWCGLKDVF